MLFIDRGDIQWQYPNRVGNIEKCRTFCCRLTLPNRDFNETWHPHTCRQHQSTYLHSTDTRNKWMKELNNFYGKNHSKGKKNRRGGRHSARTWLSTFCAAGNYFHYLSFTIVHSKCFVSPWRHCCRFEFFLFHRIISRQFFFCVVRCSSPFLIRRISQLFKK